MTGKNDLDPATIAAHGGSGLVPDLNMATTYARGADYALLDPANVYARDHSDITRQCESVLAQLEQAETALLFPSGMAAIAAVFRTLPAGADIVAQSGIYWGTTAWLRDFCARRDVALHEVDTADPAQLETSIAAHKPQITFIETPSNPWLKTTDIVRAADLTHAAGGLLVVDSTAATPILSQPLNLGADIVMHSATKAINGHSDVLAGVLATNAPDAPIWQAIATDRHDAGAVINPFAAWLLLRGMRTLPLRVARMSESAMTIASHFAAHPKIDAVYYPGLPDHPGHAIAARQMHGGFGGLMSILVKGDAADALRATGRLQLFTRATSLGGVESLVEHRHTIEPHTGIPPNLLRLSIGIEDAGDLIADLEQALG
ncbi:trans-sulfuration enzyme family protein [Octadecabacter sp. R77987]|uniref:trans-sulfuration enzyme family protein n=1 Tax=Octadecabacter sp. R77987 TaxID=3093874 RepID=UPI00366E255B